MQLGGVEVDVAREQAEAECEAWPVGGVLAGRGFVPGRAAAVPDAALEPFLDVRRIGVLTRGLDVDELQLAIEQRADALQYVVHLRFEHEHDRAVREIGVWPVQHEQVREATDAEDRNSTRLNSSH